MAQSLSEVAIGMYDLDDLAGREGFDDGSFIDLGDGRVMDPSIVHEMNTETLTLFAPKVRDTLKVMPREYHTLLADRFNARFGEPELATYERTGEIFDELRAMQAEGPGVDYAIDTMHTMQRQVEEAARHATHFTAMSTGTTPRPFARFDPVRGLHLFDMTRPKPVLRANVIVNDGFAVDDNGQGERHIANIAEISVALQAANGEEQPVYMHRQQLLHLLDTDDTLTASAAWATFTSVPEINPGLIAETSAAHSELGGLDSDLNIEALKQLGVDTMDNIALGVLMATRVLKDNSNLLIPTVLPDTDMILGLIDVVLPLSGAQTNRDISQQLAGTMMQLVGGLEKHPNLAPAFEGRQLTDTARRLFKHGLLELVTRIDAIGYEATEHEAFPETAAIVLGENQKSPDRYGALVLTPSKINRAAEFFAPGAGGSHIGDVLVANAVRRTRSDVAAVAIVNEI